MKKEDFNPIDLELEKEFKDSEDLEQYRMIVRAGISQWLRNLKDGEIKLNTVQDLKVLIETEKLLQRDK